MDIVLLVFATFWVWATFRALMENYLPQVFSLLRPVHPLVAAVLPLYVLWPHWVSALAVAGIVGLLVAAVDRVFSPTPVQQVPVPRRRTPGGLPPLP